MYHEPPPLRSPPPTGGAGMHFDHNVQVTGPHLRKLGAVSVALRAIEGVALGRGRPLGNLIACSIWIFL